MSPSAAPLTRKTSALVGNSADKYTTLPARRLPTGFLAAAPMATLLLQVAQRLADALNVTR